jgi:uroporphyrinogen-III decarboxylase
LTGKERIATALQGGKPDRVPILPIYTAAYILTAAGRDPRAWLAGTPEDRLRLMDDTLRIHPEVDGCFVHPGKPADWADRHRVERFDGYWRVTERATGAQYGVSADGLACAADGGPAPHDYADLDATPHVRAPQDVDRTIGPAPTEDEMRASGRYDTLRHVAAQRPDLHLTVQASSPLIGAVDACGGYVPGLLTLQTEPDLFRLLLARSAEHQCARFGPAREAGADSIFFTSYYGGADAIDPATYAELVFPYDRTVCEAARNHGMAVLHWYLGDLMPNLGTVRRLPTDALVLEQSRKSYRIDLGEIRARVGPEFCLFGFGHEQDFVTCNREGLSRTLREQYAAAGRDGAFVTGTPNIPPDADPAAVDHYFAEARRLGESGP